MRHTNNTQKRQASAVFPYRKLWVLLISCIIACNLHAQKEKLPDSRYSADEINTLLSRLNTDFPGMEKVKAAADRPEEAIKELLTFYRNGGAGKHPLDKNDRSKSRGSYATEKEIESADNALKHILTGQGAYPPFYRGEDIDWLTNPVPDNEWIWQLNRMGFWIDMGKTYWHTGDEKYAGEWVAQLLHWTRKNPNDKAHAVAWRSIEAGIRGNFWTTLFQYFIDSPAFTEEALTAFLNSCYDHASYLMGKYTVRSNWALIEAAGMAYIAITFPQFKDAEKWRTEAFRRFNEEISLQVYPDGFQHELSMGYHTGCISLFMVAYDLAKLNGIEGVLPENYLRIIEKMCEVPMKICLPDGTSTGFGDDWRGRPGQYKNRFLHWAKLFDRRDFLFLGTDGNEGEAPAQTAFALPQSGMYSMRSGWDTGAVFLALKCGPDGGWHCQPDNGTFVLYAGGRNLMPDAGCYVYSGDPEGREWFRQTKVHKTLTLDNKNSRYRPKQLYWSPGDGLDILVVENGSYENLRHRRSVFFVDKTYFVFVDEAIGSATGQLDLHFQFAPGDAVFDENRYVVRSAFDEGWNVSVKANPLKGMKLIREEGQSAPAYQMKEACPAFAYRIDKKTPESVRFITVVMPYSGTKAPDVSVKLLENTESSMSLKVKAGNRTRKIGYSF
ncbi:MAG: heparinase II/III family protein [Prevotellaceae bacterium]|jgi:heparan-sulfate lyase|nr:heparinase II/III family protein [Prevotellaceae bacterium]